MVIRNIYLRIFVGTFWIAMGLACLKIYVDRHKDNFWGKIFRSGEEDIRNKKNHLYTDKIYLILGCLSVLAGIIALVYGFKTTIGGH